ncbi:MAG: Rieske 2Fe-2S domain-containing protein [Anaerolineae bacterium]|nr:Rieske 2Fe-2S domain-containing protein [Anaerolineae bacterium]
MAFETVASTEELGPGNRIIVEVGDLWVIVFNVDGRYYAFEDRCTHDDGSFDSGSIDQQAIECPRHGARFSLEDGKPTMPATKPVPRFAVRVEGQTVQVDITQRLN